LGSKSRKTLGKLRIEAELMEVIIASKELNVKLDVFRKNGIRIGFVPTMGALHDGHVSLIHEAKTRCDYVVLSIFINPTQFNDSIDFDNYPSPHEEDLALAESSGADVVFMPSADDLYQGNPRVDRVNYGLLTDGFEAAERPGHFDGVVAVVRRLFAVVKPGMALFGEKDLQQLAVVRKLAEEEFPDLEIIGCPLIRDLDGLAMSSRNARLSDHSRVQALAIPRSIKQIQSAVLDRQSIDQALNQVKTELEHQEGVKLEYLEVIDGKSFELYRSGDQGVPYVLIAAEVEGVRLLDNIPLDPNRRLT
jgi:pantoate--beta-alanine ligase